MNKKFILLLSVVIQTLCLVGNDNIKKNEVKRNPVLDKRLGHLEELAKQFGMIFDGEDRTVNLNMYHSPPSFAEKMMEIRSYIIKKYPEFESVAIYMSPEAACLKIYPASSPFPTRINGPNLRVLYAPLYTDVGYFFKAFFDGCFKVKIQDNMILIDINRELLSECIRIQGDGVIYSRVFSLDKKQVKKVLELSGKNFLTKQVKKQAINKALIDSPNGG